MIDQSICSNCIHRSLMSAIVGEKNLAILLPIWVNYGLGFGSYIVDSWKDCKWRWGHVRGG